MKTTSIFQSAQDNWPEDEAAGIAESFRGICEDYPETMERNVADLKKDCEHMEGIFMRESDGAELCARFRKAIALELGKRSPQLPAAIQS